MRNLVAIFMVLALSIVASAGMGKSTFIRVTPTIDTAIYSSGDQVGSLMEFTNAVSVSGGTGILLDVSIVDKDKEAAALVLHLFSDKPTVTSSDNGALNIADSEMATKYICSVVIAAADYTTLSANSVSTSSGGCILKSTKSSDNTKGTSVWGILSTTGTPTYTTTTDLVIQLGIAQD